MGPLTFNYKQAGNTILNAFVTCILVRMTLSQSYNSYSMLVDAMNFVMSLSSPRGHIHLLYTFMCIFTSIFFVFLNSHIYSSPKADSWRQVTSFDSTEREAKPHSETEYVLVVTCPVCIVFSAGEPNDLDTSWTKKTALQKISSIHQALTLNTKTRRNGPMRRQTPEANPSIHSCLNSDQIR